MNNKVRDLDCIIKWKNDGSVEVEHLSGLQIVGCGNKDKDKNLKIALTVMEKVLNVNNTIQKNTI